MTQGRNHRESGKYFEMNENEATTYQSLKNVMKAGLREKIITINMYIWIMKNKVERYDVENGKTKNQQKKKLILWKDQQNWPLWARMINKIEDLNY